MKINVDALTVCDISPSSLINSALTHDHTNRELFSRHKLKLLVRVRIHLFHDQQQGGVIV